MTLGELATIFAGLMVPLGALAAYVRSIWQKRERELEDDKKSLEEALKKSEAANRELMALFITHISENREGRDEVVRMLRGRA